MSLFLLKRICATTALLTLASCHDAPRTNPFDPALTPAVELQVALDDTAGTATLTWSRYEGQQPFREYRVLRNIADRKSVDTLVHIAAVAQTAFVDTTLAPNTAYVYRVETLNAGGYAAPSEEKGIAGYGVAPVSLVEVEVDAHQGQTRLRWTHFTGARFQGYRVERRSGEEERFSVVRRLAGISDTTWTDADLAPEVSYFYQIVVEAAGSDWPSNPSSRQGFSLEAVQLSVETNQATGRARLRWTPFQGPDFQGYRVERRSEEELDFGMIGRLATQSDTAYTDTTLAPDISYFYRVVVVAGGRDWPSAPSSSQGFELRGVSVQILPGFSSLGISLGWLDFFGPNFQRYRVLRRVVGTGVGETITQTTQRSGGFGGATAFTDTSARHGVEYEYWVVVEAAGQELVGTSAVASFDLPPSAMKPPVFSAATASAALRWSLYQGPHFRAYRVERRTAGLVPQVVAELPDKTVLSYVDADLAGNTEYFYRVVVLTTREEEVASEEVSGSFHNLMDTWPLEVEEGEYVRLYREGEGITALVAGEHRVRLFFFDSGGKVGEQVLWDYPNIQIEPRAAATYLSPEGSRVLSLTAEGNLFLLHFGPEAGPVWREYPVFVDSLSILSEEARSMKGQVRLGGGATYDDVLVTSRGEVLFADDFEGGDLAERWSLLLGAEVANGQLTVSPSGTARKEEASWQDFRLEATVTLPRQGSTGTISIGDYLSVSSTFSSFSLTLNGQAQTIRLRWRFRPPENSELANEGQSFTESFPVFLGIPYRLGLEFVAGKVSTSIQSPIVWSGTPDPSSPWACLAGLEEKLTFVNGSPPYQIDLAARSADLIKSTLDSPPSEIRIWERTSTENTRAWIGICLPERHQVLAGQTGVSKATGRLIWPALHSTSAAALGDVIGQGPGDFLYPLSFDGAADGRIYVLDAGNARIQVFDTEGKYLTQWGHKGSGEGEFDFGSGRVPENFAGSVAVDSEGYIYVADVGNQRIKKFAP